MRRGSMSQNEMFVQVEGREVRLTNLDKVYWPGEGYTKADLIDYCTAVAPYILPHLEDRPLSLVRYPDGIGAPGFYQKDAPKGMPDWVRVLPVKSKEKGSYINFVLCHDVATLVWLANSGVIEINPWLSSYPHLNSPDFAVFDIDPAEGATWEDVKVVAKMVRTLLQEWNLAGYPKLSGATGLHVFVPLELKYTFRQVSSFVGYAASLIEAAYPEKVTLERRVKSRAGHVYIDYPQVARGQTISTVYGVRARRSAPVSVPILWEELDQFHPASFNIRNAVDRVRSVGDLFAPVLSRRQNIDRLLRTAAPG